MFEAADVEYAEHLHQHRFYEVREVVPDSGIVEDDDHDGDDESSGEWKTNILNRLKKSIFYIWFSLLSLDIIEENIDVVTIQLPLNMVTRAPNVVQADRAASASNEGAVGGSMNDESNEGAVGGAVIAMQRNDGDDASLTESSSSITYDDLVRREREEQTMRWVNYHHNVNRDDQLKKRIDVYLNSPSKGMYIDPDIVGYAMVNHQYMLMTPDERKRLNNLRLEVARVQSLIAQNNDAVPTEPICPVCFDEIKFKPVVVLPCGHIHCADCFARIRANDNSEVGRCAVCATTIGDDSFRLFLSYRH